MRRLCFAILTGIMLLTACSNRNSPSNTNFKDVINQHLQTHGQACTWLGQPFPVNVSESQPKLSSGIASRMITLEQAGLVQAARMTVNTPQVLGGSIQRSILRYQLTDAGKQYLDKAQGPLATIAGFCYGTKAVDSVIKWTEPVTVGPITETQVTYTYAIPNLASWARRPDLQAHFEDIRTTISGISKADDVAGLQLTNRGWEVAVR